MMKKKYIKPTTKCVVVEIAVQLMAGSNKGKSQTLLGDDPSVADKTIQIDDNGVINDNDDIILCSKGFSAWDSWDD